MKIAITTYCTKSYTYALEAQMPLCVQNIQLAGQEKGVFIMAGDTSEEVKTVFDKYVKAMQRVGFQSVLVVLDVACNENKDHQQSSNIVIAKLQAAAWHEARMHNVDICWSLESDILPQPKSLRTLISTLQWDGGWYDVVMGGYPNAEFLGGRGTPQSSILPTIYDDERLLSDEVKARIELKKTREKELQAANKQPTEEDVTEWKNLDAEVKKSPAAGNVFELNAKRWRQRGWLTSAYPGVGLGAILPTDWVGLGCTLISKRALQLAHFTGYDGQGTQDLWLGWKAWQPAGIRMAVVPHVLCDHVKQRKDEKGNTSLQVMHAEHELWTECHGHLRSNTREWHGI